MNRPSQLLPFAGRINWTGRSQLRLAGKDRTTFMHNFCTNDIKKLAPGSGCEAFLTNDKSRILGHVFIFADNEFLTVDTVPDQAGKIHDHLDRYLISDDVQMTIRTEMVDCVYLFGSGAAAAINEYFQVDVSSLPACGHVTVAGNERAGGELIIRRLDLTAAPGFEVVLPRSEAYASPSPAFTALLESDAFTEVTASDFDAYRIDAGFPIYGVDLSSEMLAQEANRTAKAISFTKGCYLGQEPIARIDALGHVNREIKLVAFEEGAPLTVPVAIKDVATSAMIGQLTSVSEVNGSTPVGIGLLKTAAKPGTAVITDEPSPRAGVIVAPFSN